MHIIGEKVEVVIYIFFGCKLHFYLKNRGYKLKNSEGGGVNLFYPPPTSELNPITILGYFGLTLYFSLELDALSHLKIGMFGNFSYLKVIFMFQK